MDSKDFKTTRSMILGRVLVVPFVTVALVFGTLVYYFASNLSSLERARLVRVAEGHCSLIGQFLHERCAWLQFVADTNSFDELAHGNKLGVILEELQAQSSAFFDIGLFDEAGNHIRYIGPFKLEGINYAHTQWFQQVKEKGVYISDVFLGYRKVPHFVIAVRRVEGPRTWYLRTTIDSSFFNDLVERVRIGRMGEAYLIDDKGELQTRRRSGGNLMEVDADHGSYEVPQTGIASFTSKDQTGKRYLYATGRVELTSWILVVRQEISEAYAPLIRAMLVAVGMIVAGGAVVIVMAFMLASGVANELVMADVERRRMSSQLIMAGKLAEVGEMSAGVAHEINNPLQVIKGEETYMKDILDEMEAKRKGDDAENFRLLRESIDQIALQVDRGRKITKGLLGFARKSETKIEPLDLCALLKDVVEMVEHHAAVENVRIVEEIDADLPMLKSDSSQLQQVFLNLLNNSIDAVKEKGGGEIRIAAALAGDDVTVSVTDDGCGIAPEHLEKVFLPFFTTKPVGQGTGLGLSTCYGIVEHLGGTITVTSELNVGTVFTVRLPLAALTEDNSEQSTIWQEGVASR